MGNTKTYYLEGDLRQYITLEDFKKKLFESFRASYVIAEIDLKGYLGVVRGRPPFAIAAIHSYSTEGDLGPERVAPLFQRLLVHRMDIDGGDVWAGTFQDGALKAQWGFPLTWKDALRPSAPADDLPTGR